MTTSPCPRGGLENPDTSHDDDTIVIERIRDDAPPEATTTDEPSTPAHTHHSGFGSPGANTPVSELTSWVSQLAELRGEPLSIDISALLREVTISLPSREHFTAWCTRLEINGQGQTTMTDDLGTLMSAESGGAVNGTWRVRLIWHGRR